MSSTLFWRCLLSISPVVQIGNPCGLVAVGSSHLRCQSTRCGNGYLRGCGSLPRTRMRSGAMPAARHDAEFTTMRLIRGFGTASFKKPFASSPT